MMMPIPKTTADELSKPPRWEKEVSSDCCSLSAVAALKTNPTRQQMLKQRSCTQHEANIQVSKCPLEFFFFFDSVPLPLGLPPASGSARSSRLGTADRGGECVRLEVHLLLQDPAEDELGSDDGD